MWDYVKRRADQRRPAETPDLRPLNEKHKKQSQSVYNKAAP